MRYNITNKTREGNDMRIEVLSNLVITQVHSASTLYTPEGTKIRRNNRPQWAIVIKYEGETVYMSGGKRFVSDINHIIILPKGCSYDWECTKSGHYFIIEFECTAKAYEPMRFSVKNGDKILKLVKEMESKRNLRRPTSNLESLRDTYSVLLSLMQSSTEKYTPNSKQKRLEGAIEYISQHYNGNITNDALAAVAGMSTVYFRKLFTEVMGISPISYARRLRIDKAKEMLKSDYGTLGDIAQFLGYSSLYDFSRDFKKHTGVAPSKY